MAHILILGSTGLVGSNLLQVARNASSTSIASIDIIARRSPPATTTKANIIPNEYISTDLSTWASTLSSIAPRILFSALATTRAAAGGFDKQYQLEHDLNIELARAAKTSGTKIYVLISSSGANTASPLGYPKMKGEIEEHIQELDFDHTIILRPGLIGGERQESRPAEYAVRSIAKGLEAISSGLVDWWKQDAEVIAKAAINAALKVDRGEHTEKVWVVGQADIMKLGKHEWKDI